MTRWITRATCLCLLTAVPLALPTHAQAPAGTLVFRANADCELLIDGETAATLKKNRITKRPVVVGEHIIEARAADGRVWERTYVAKPGSQVLKIQFGTPVAEAAAEARRELQRGNLHAALTTLDSGLARAPRSAALLRLRADANEKLGANNSAERATMYYDSAVADLEKVLKISPKTSDAKAIRVRIDHIRAKGSKADAQAKERKADQRAARECRDKCAEAIKECRNELDEAKETTLNCHNVYLRPTYCSEYDGPCYQDLLRNYNYGCNKGDEYDCDEAQECEDNMQCMEDARATCRAEIKSLDTRCRILEPCAQACGS